MTMAPDDVADVLALLADADPRVLGGWGVDALVGRQTRGHRDLDLAVRADALDDSVAALIDHGYLVVTDWLPVRVELVDGADRVVDLHPLRFAEDGSAWQAGLGDSHYDYPADCWTRGCIGGRVVVCVADAWQRLAHSGYEPRPIDLHDLAVLDELGAG